MPPADEHHADESITINDLVVIPLRLTAPLEVPKLLHRHPLERLCATGFRSRVGHAEHRQPALNYHAKMADRKIVVKNDATMPIEIIAGPTNQ
jgi:hypothetical protein